MIDATMPEFARPLPRWFRKGFPILGWLLVFFAPAMIWDLSGLSIVPIAQWSGKVWLQMTIVIVLSVANAVAMTNFTSVRLRVSLHLCRDSRGPKFTSRPIPSDYVFPAFPEKPNQED